MNNNKRLPLIKPNEYMGIIGGGQLGRMLVMAAARLGIKTVVFAENTDCPAFAVADEFITGSYHDAALLDAFSRKCGVITYEFENIPLSVVSYLSSRTAVYPQANILSVSQDRLSEKTFLNAIGIPTAVFSAVAYEGDIKSHLEKTGNAGILKTRKFGYDGKGQTQVLDAKSAVQSYYDINEVPAIIEDKIAFKKEFSIIAARTINGDFYHYDTSENQHQDGILHISTVPADLTAEQNALAIAYTKKIADSLNYVGVLAVEYFLTQDNQILANEIAPRVHNSGHWTIDACVFDQFENHIRAVCGWPMGSFMRHSDAVMQNLLGHDVDKWHELVSNPNTTLHLYGKSEVRSGRKMGHSTRLSQKSV
jgi:5-(carboxyamino)imidazole ribonucleotide synthase